MQGRALQKRVGIGLAAGLTASAIPSHAQTLSGQAATYLGSSFSLSGNTISVADNGGTLDFGSGPVGLNGINQLLVVTPDGGHVPGVGIGPIGSQTVYSADGRSAPWYGSQLPTGYITTNWTAPDTPWLMIGPGTRTSPYTNGVFQFTGLTTAPDYDLEVGYLLANGRTGTAIFPLPVAPVPEAPGAGLLAAGGLLLAAPIWRAVRRRGI